MSGGSRVELNPTFVELATSLKSRLLTDFSLRQNGRRVIGVGGESGSGKTVTANCLAEELLGAGMLTAVIHQDDYFRLPPRANHGHRCLDLHNVGPHEVNLDLLQSHIDAFRSGREHVPAPLVDYPSDTFLAQRFDFSRTAVLIVEGTYILSLEDIDVRIFLRATHVETREGRRARNRDIDEPVIEDVLEIEHGIISPQVRLADIVVNRDFVIDAKT